MQAHGQTLIVTAEPDDADRQLLRRLRLRDRAALEDLARTYGRALTRAAYLYLGDTHAGEDVAQDTLLAAWDAAGRTAPDTRLRPWLFGVLFNRCRKYRRSLWRRLWRERRAAERRRAEVSAGEAFETRLAALREALARLPENLRIIVILRFERQLTVAETAAALGIPEGTVKSRTHAAIERLRGEMRSSDA